MKRLAFLLRESKRLGMSGVALKDRSGSLGPGDPVS